MALSLQRLCVSALRPRWYLRVLRCTALLRLELLSCRLILLSVACYLATSVTIGRGSRWLPLASPVLLRLVIRCVKLIAVVRTLQ